MLYMYGWTERRNTLGCFTTSFWFPPPQNAALSTHCRASEGSPHTHTIIFSHGQDGIAYEFAEDFCPDADGPDGPFPDNQMGVSASQGSPLLKFDIDRFDLWPHEYLQERSELQVPGLQS